MLYRNYNLNFNVLAVIEDFGLAITVVCFGLAYLAELLLVMHMRSA